MKKIQNLKKEFQEMKKQFQTLNLLQKISVIVLLFSMLFFVAYGVYDLVVHVFEAVPAPEFDYGSLLSWIGIILGGLSVIGLVVGYRLDVQKEKKEQQEKASMSMDEENPAVSNLDEEENKENIEE